jgi:hypothetical protein
LLKKRGKKVVKKKEGCYKKKKVVKKKEGRRLLKKKEGCYKKKKVVTKKGKDQKETVGFL